MKAPLLLLLVLWALPAGARNVSCIPRDNYDQARQYVETRFACEVWHTPRSSWIAYGEFCRSGAVTAFVMKVKTGQRKAYLYEGMPAAVWSAFKAAPSAGRFYNREIKGRYRFLLASELASGDPRLTCLSNH